MSKNNIHALYPSDESRDVASGGDGRHVRKSVDGGNGGGDDETMELDKRVTAIETLLPTLMTKSDGEGLRADLHKMDASIKTWMIATIIGLFFGFAGLFFAMNSAIKAPLQAIAPQAPVVINVPPP